MQSRAKKHAALMEQSALIKPDIGFNDAYSGKEISFRADDYGELEISGMTPDGKTTVLTIKHDVVYTLINFLKNNWLPKEKEGENDDR